MKDILKNLNELIKFLNTITANSIENKKASDYLKLFVCLRTLDKTFSFRENTKCNGVSIQKAPTPFK